MKEYSREIQLVAKNIYFLQYVSFRDVSVEQR